MASAPLLRRFSPRAALSALGVGLVAAAGLLFGATPAEAHSLESSTVSAHVTDEGVDATISIARESLDQALAASTGADVSTLSSAEYTDLATDYIAEHLTVTGVDGSVWAETFTEAQIKTVEGIESFTVDVAFDTGGSDTSGFELSYDAVIEALPEHEAVVVLTDAAGDISTPGVLTNSTDTLTIGDVTGAGTATSNWLDMIGYGFHHVLEGADHLLFLTALLLAAPVVVSAGRWATRSDPKATMRNVLGVVTAFTIGHSLTLIGSSLGWVDAPTTLVEVLVAVSVAVAAIHAIRPLINGGEAWIAAGFGLVHGLAFAGILDGLGFSGTTSVPLLLAFNVGVELAQLTATLLVFPALYLLARTRWYAAVRWIGGGIALAAAAGWVVDRLGWLSNPFQGVEDAAIAHPWVVVTSLAAIAATATFAERRLRSGAVAPAR